MTTDAAPSGPAPAGMGAEAYEGKAPTYFTQARHDYVDALPDDPSASVLEVGCSAGGTGALALARGKCARYVGVELHPPSAEAARGRLTEVITGDVEKMDLPFPPESFDALILSEVLEHLVDPWSALARLARLVRPGGLILASSPNVSHHTVIRALIRGEWELKQKGIMDRTHMRWFTPRSYRALIEGAGFEVEEIRSLQPFRWRGRIINALTFGRFSHVFYYQITVRGRRTAVLPAPPAPA